YALALGLLPRSGLLRPTRGLSSGGLSRLGHVVGLGDLDTPPFRRRHDLLAGGLLLRPGLEVGLVEPSHGVTDMLVVVDREMALALLVDVRELALVHLFSFLGVELSQLELL